MPISGKPEIGAPNPPHHGGLRRSAANPPYIAPRKLRPICRTKSWELTLFSADLGLGKLLLNL
jgi:hypothetical protein